MQRDPKENGTTGCISQLIALLEAQNEPTTQANCKFQITSKRHYLQRKPNKSSFL